MGVSVILGKITMRTFRIPAPSKSAMSEVEFGRLLDAVRTAIAPLSQEDFLNCLPMPNQQSKPGNDNGLAWPLLPFPEGWYGA
jgi:hypothetical protein